MKLPGVQYSGVQSLGRDDPGAPQRVAGAQYRAVQKQGNMIEQVHRQIDRLYRVDAESEYNKRLLDYEEKAQAAQEEITSNPYEEDEEGNLVSRHDKVFGEYADTEEQIRKEVLDSTDNALARQDLETKLRERSMQHRGEVAQTAAKWTKAESNRRYVTSIERSLRMGKYEEARELYVDAASMGALSPEQMLEIPEIIQADEQYSVIQEKIGGLQGPKDYQALRKDLGDPNKYPNISPSQRVDLNDQLDKQINDSLTRGLHDVVQEAGLDAGLDYIRSVNRAKPGEIGLSGEEAHYGATTRLQQIYKDYLFEADQNEADQELDAAAYFINQGGWADPEKDGRAMDRAFSNWMEENEVQPYSPEWVGRVQWHAETQGWVPPDVMSDVRGMLNHGQNESVLAAAELVSLLSRSPETSRAVRDNMSEDDIRLAQMVNDYASYGQNPVETIDKIREGLNQVPDAHIRARSAEFDESIGTEVGEHLEEKISDDEDSSSWYQFMTLNPEATIELQEEYRRLTRREYTRTGDKDFALKRGYQLLRNKYAVVERGGDMRLAPNSPESIVGQGRPTPWITEEYNNAVEELGRDPESLELIHFRHGGKDKWYFYDREANDIVPSPDNPAEWATIDFDYSKSADQRRRQEDLKEAEIAAQENREQAIAQEKARQRHMEQLEEMGGAAAGPGPQTQPSAPPGAAAAERRNLAEALDKGGQKFWELILGKPGAQPMDPSQVPEKDQPGEMNAPWFR